MRTTSGQLRPPNSEVTAQIIRAALERLVAHPQANEWAAALGNETRTFAIFFGAAFAKVNAFVSETTYRQVLPDGSVPRWLMELLVEEMVHEALESLEAISNGKNPYAGTEWEQLAVKYCGHITGLLHEGRQET